MNAEDILKQVKELQTQANDLRRKATILDEKADTLMKEVFGIADGDVVTSHLFISVILKLLHNQAEQLKKK